MATPLALSLRLTRCERTSQSNGKQTIQSTTRSHLVKSSYRSFVFEIHSTYVEVPTHIVSSIVRFVPPQESTYREAAAFVHQDDRGLHLLLKFEKISSTGSDFAQKSGQFHRKIEARLPKFPKFQRFAKFTSNMGPNQFLNFLDLCGPSNSHHMGLKLLPWDRRRLMLKYILLSTRCQNFSSIGPIGQKFDVFAKMAFKSTASAL